MFFRGGKRRVSGRDASRSSDPEANRSQLKQSEQWRSWQLCAQKVWRAWNEWLATDRRQRAELYRRYIAALAEEERAAAKLEHLIKCDAQTQGTAAGMALAAPAHRNPTSDH